MVTTAVPLAIGYYEETNHRMFSHYFKSARFLCNVQFIQRNSFVSFPRKSFYGRSLVTRIIYCIDLPPFQSTIRSLRELKQAMKLKSKTTAYVGYFWHNNKTKPKCWLFSSLLCLVVVLIYTVIWQTNASECYLNMGSNRITLNERKKINWIHLTQFYDLYIGYYLQRILYFVQIWSNFRWNIV